MYKPAVVAPSAACKSRFVELVLLPPAKLPVTTVATNGTVVIKPNL